jgi:tetratricopeptide (TPR) repeat protein
MAELYLLKTDLTNAAKCFQEALSINPISTRAHLGMGKIFTDQENATLALESFDKAEKFEQNIQEKVNVLLCRCKCLLSLKQPNQALATIKNLTCSFPGLLNDSKTVGIIVGMMSECYQTNGDWLQARQYARKQLKIGLEQKDNSLVLNAFRTLANIYEQNGQFGNAVRLIEKQLEIIAQIPAFLIHHVNDQKLQVLRKCGSLQAQLGNWETAIGVFEERLKLIRTSNLKTLELEAYSDLVKVYKKMKDNNQRMAYIESMSKLLEENPQLLTKQEWIYQEDLGEYYMDTEKLEDAREAFERALMLVQEIDHQTKEAELCAALGQVHLRLGEDDEALVYFQQCLTLSQQTRNVNIEHIDRMHN